jgi:hypothetical protein
LEDGDKKITIIVYFLILLSTLMWGLWVLMGFDKVIINSSDEEFYESLLVIIPFILLILASILWDETEMGKRSVLERRIASNKAAGYRPEFWEMSPEQIKVASNIAFEKKRSEELRSRRVVALERDPKLRKMTHDIFSNVREYDISIYTNSLSVRVNISQTSRDFTYRNIYDRDLEDIQEEMESDLISPKPTTRRRYSRYHGGANDVGDSGSDLGDTMDE